MKDKEFDKHEKTTEIIASVGMAVALSSFTSLIPGLSSINTLALITGSTIVTSPFIYYGMKKIKEKLNERVERDMHHASQIALMMQDALETDRQITSMTSLFLKEILEYLEQEQVTLAEDQEMNINQFLYLINANYYEELNKKYPSLNREHLIRHILSVTMSYYQQTNKKTFDENDAKEILNKSFIIPNELKEPIFEEFKKSKIKFGKKTFYEIIRKDTDSSFDNYFSKRNEEKNDNWTRFDIDDANDYHTIIQVFADEESIQELGNAHELEWDMELLVRMMKLIATNYRQELIKEKEDYTNFKLVSTFIYNAMSYALVNNKKEVGYKELLNTFKNWRFLSFQMKLKVLDDIFEQESFDYKDHPFEVKKSKKPHQKIIEFPRQTENK